MEIKSNLVNPITYKVGKPVVCKYIRQNGVAHDSGHILMPEELKNQYFNKEMFIAIGREMANKNDVIKWYPLGGKNYLYLPEDYTIE